MGAVGSRTARQEIAAAALALLTVLAPAEAAALQEMSPKAVRTINISVSVAPKISLSGNGRNGDRYCISTNARRIDLPVRLIGASSLDNGTATRVDVSARLMPCGALGPASAAAPVFSAAWTTGEIVLVQPE